ncbi:hypothetical protein [Deltalipothrixvirus pozzuoliense]|uniref:Uncharacterized protein ORF217a n=1 Tax=Acidianus filamentous virus 2 (isolate Italy/Pozzuoli) TaxID=654910 RepID=Y217A_AFV2P|nr:hypothetical protein AFV2_gp31 [Acidianus filamentous virus 2]Q573D8.1 RecName: Full=Uncharacterized protein ORF217a [Acidianus filamentous virus 2 (isolate Pozzuoli)]CAH69418.1 hypothetical protein [Acidianus filamentous virus 2]
MTLKKHRGKMSEKSNVNKKFTNSTQNNSNWSNSPSMINPESFINNPNLIVFKNWVDKLQQEFPTCDVVDSKNNSITIKIRYDDVFRSIYKEVKKSVPDSKVSLKPCNDDKKYGMCMVVKSKTIIVGWEEWGFGKPIEISGEGEFTYYIPLENVINAFDSAWRMNNKGKPLHFKFMTRRLTPRDATTKGVSAEALSSPPTVGEIWHYITIEFVTVTTT